MFVTFSIVRFLVPFGLQLWTLGAPMWPPWIRFVTLLGSPLMPFGSLWLPFGFRWLPFGSLWFLLVQFGSIWHPFGSLWISFDRWLPFGSLLAPLGSHLASIWLHLALFWLHLVSLWLSFGSLWLRSAPLWFSWSRSGFWLCRDYVMRGRSDISTTLVIRHMYTYAAKLQKKIRPNRAFKSRLCHAPLSINKTHIHENS